MSEKPDEERSDKPAEQELADQRAREADDMAERSEQLLGEIEETRSRWESRKADGNVPGAAGQPHDPPDGDSPAQFPAKDGD